MIATILSIYILNICGWFVVWICVYVIVRHISTHNTHNLQYVDIAVYVYLPGALARLLLNCNHYINICEYRYTIYGFIIFVYKKQTVSIFHHKQ